MNYNNIYSNSKNAWGSEPNKLLQMIIDDIPANSHVLDLGSAQGRDALYLASLGHIVTAVEKSEVGHQQLRQVISNHNTTNITALNEDIVDFEINDNMFLLISLQNSLQFLQKEISLKLIEKIKNKLSQKGFVSISSFTVDDPSYLNPNTKIKSHFNKQELLNIFSDFQIIYYFEKKVLDKGHAGQPEPHYHGMVKLIAQKL